MKIEEVKQCSFENWYNNFKKVTIKSIILPLPDGFIKYILKDGIVLPESAVINTFDRNESDASDEEENWENSDVNQPEAPHFFDFDASIEDAIETLGGRVFPKLNWSSPKDASWIAFNNSCCCTSVSDIYLLLKSSDFIIHDITQPFKLCEDFIRNQDVANTSTVDQTVQQFYLILRKWTEIDVSGEFRCFVKNNKLIAISQREDSLFFEHINLSREEIIDDIVSFFNTNIMSKFPLSNYVFDVYRKKRGHVSLIDFNPFGTVTESLLFSWEELKFKIFTQDQNNGPVFRCIDDNCGVQPRTLSYHALPRDIVDISTGEDSFKLVDLMKLKIDEQNDSSTDEEIIAENGKM